MQASTRAAAASSPTPATTRPAVVHSRPNDRVPARSLGKAGDAGDQVGRGFTSDGTTCGFHGCRKLVDLAFAYTEPGCQTGSEAQPAQPVFFCNAAHARAAGTHVRGLAASRSASHRKAPAVAVPLEPEVAAAAMEISPPPAGSPIAESPTPGHGEAATPVKRSRERRTNDEKAGLEDIGNGIKRSVLRYSVDDALARSTQRVDKLLADLEAGWRPEARPFEKGTKWLNNPAYVLALHKVITTIWWHGSVASS